MHITEMFCRSVIPDDPASRPVQAGQRDAEIASSLNYTQIFNDKRHLLANPEVKNGLRSLLLQIWWISTRVQASRNLMTTS